MKKSIKILLILLIIALVVGVFLPLVFSALGMNFYILPPSLKTLGKDGIRLMDKFGIYSSTEEWAQVRDSYRDLAMKAQSEEDLVKVLDDAVQIAGGKHSSAFFQKSTEEEKDSYIDPTIERKDDLIYIKVPEFSSTQEMEEAYAEKISESLKDKKIKKVMIDLRDNPGGSMYPMILGLSPLLPDGKVFSFVGKDQEDFMAIDLEDGKITSYPNLQVSNVEKLEDVKIAVLAGDNTASSGEATLLALKGLPNVRVFGKPSAGYLSTNQMFPLGDKIILNLTLGFFKDRDGNIYGEEAILPDVDTDNPYEDGLSWLNE